MMNDDAEQFALVCLYAGYASVTLVKGTALAIRAFIQEANLVADLFPSGEIKVYGQDIDSGLPELVMAVNGQACVLLQKPSTVDDTTIRGNKPAQEPLPALPGIDEENSFTGVSAWLTWAYEDRDPAESTPRQEAALRSWPAMHFSRDYNEIYPQVAEDSADEVGEAAPHGDRRALRKALDEIHFTYSMTLTL